MTRHARVPASFRSAPHVGEWKVTLRADSLAELFAEGARVVSRASGRTSGAPAEWERISLSARDTPTLLADWLNELIGRSEVEGRAYGEVRGLTVAAHPGALAVRLDAEVRGTPVARWRSPLKAATYHDLSVARTDGGWRAQVVLDV